MEHQGPADEYTGAFSSERSTRFQQSRTTELLEGEWNIQQVAKSMTPIVMYANCYVSARYVNQQPCVKSNRDDWW